MTTFIDRLRGPLSRRLLPGVLFVVILLGVGFATYYLGGERNQKPPAVEATSVKLTYGLDRGGYDLTASLELPWGTGSGQVAMSPASNSSTLESVFLGASGRVYVVDHVPGKVGARIQWFEKGKLAGVSYAPGGSTLFTPDGDGFMYVRSKSSGPYEGVVLVNGRGSITATYTVPMGVNSGGLVRHEKTLYVRAYYSTSDPDKQNFDAKDVLVPVAIDGKQVDDSTAEKGMVEAWTILPDGERIQTREEGNVGADEQWKVRRFFRFGAMPEVEVPWSGVLLGASSTEHVVWLLLPPTAIDRRGAAGWPAAFGNEGIILRIDSKGKVLSVIPISMSRIANPPQFGWNDRVHTDGENVISATADTGRVRILTFGRR